MVKVKFLVKNKALTSYKVSNLTTNVHRANYGIYGVVKNQLLTGFGVIANDMLYVTWETGGCTALLKETADELGFEIENV